MIGRLRLLVAIGLTMLTLVGCAGSDASADDTTPSRSTVAPTNLAAAEALALLETVPVKGRAPRTGYSRDEFGVGWVDVDRNGCDTRNDLLARDLVGETFASNRSCVVTAGVLDDPYTGKRIEFRKGNTTSNDVQIDHVVALSDAWQKGAQQLSTEQRVAFANDPNNLMAVDGTANRQKGAGDAATWLPPNRSFRCTYVITQVRVKSTYALWVTGAERDAIARELGRCERLVTTTTDAPTR